jgi:hypothetical protein
MSLSFILSRCSRIVPDQHALPSWSLLNCPSLWCFQFRCLSPCSLRFIVKRCKRGFLYERHFGFVLCSEDSRTAVVTVWQSCVCLSVSDWEMVLADGHLDASVAGTCQPTIHCLTGLIKRNVNLLAPEFYI